MFRAPDAPTAVALYKAMCGFNGIALPNALYARLGGSLRTLLQDAGIGSYMGGGAAFITTYAWVAALSGIAFLLPNTQEFMRSAKPAIAQFKAVPGGAIQGSPEFLRNLAWAPTRSWSFYNGVLTAVGLLALSRISEFLYFQF